MSGFDEWLHALEARHLANLTPAELTRSLRALSSCYVERRDRLAHGAALDGAGKRAAFALFYAPLHFLTVSHIVRELGTSDAPLREIVDLGCGTGAAGAAWALACARPPALRGIDRNPWAVEEANWTYKQLGVRGRAAVGDVMAGATHADNTRGAILAYTVNELPANKRASLLERLLQQTRGGAQVLIVEPIARRVTSWWTPWTSRFAAEGGRTDEWRFPSSLPPALSEIARRAGLDPRELTARTIYTQRRT